MPQSRYLTGLDAEQRAKLEQKLLARQSGRCFICDDPIDLMLHKGQLDIDHIDPLIDKGLMLKITSQSRILLAIEARGPPTLRSLAVWRSSSGYKSKLSVKESEEPILAMCWHATKVRMHYSGYGVMQSGLFSLSLMLATTPFTRFQFTGTS